MTDQQAPTDVPTQVTCLPTKDPAVRYFIFAGMLLGFGLWCAIDAYGKGKYQLPPDPGINEKATHYLNHYGPFVMIPAGLVFAGIAVRSLRRKLQADQEGIGYAGKAKIPWDKFTGMDSSKLADKGILKLLYGDGDELVLDSWKLKNLKELVRLVEAKAPPDQQA